MIWVVIIIAATVTILLGASIAFKTPYKSDPNRWHELAKYNSEVARGIAHTDEWREKMARQQAEFDTHYKHEEEGG
jgi:hypothetical protein